MSTSKDGLGDVLIVEAVARSGGYEAVDTAAKWGAVASALGFKKDRGEEIKQRYEDLLKFSADLDEKEDEDELDYEVDKILDRKEEDGKVTYLVQWKGDGDEQPSPSWEPSANLSCPGDHLRTSLATLIKALYSDCKSKHHG